MNHVFSNVWTAIRAVGADVMRIMMYRGRHNRRWWDDVQAVDRRPMIRGLVASGVVR